MSRPQDQFPGYEYDSGWLVPTKERALSKLLRTTPAPRKFGPLDQLRVDFRSGPAAMMYLLCIGLLAAGLITTDWVLVLAGFAILAFFARGFVDGIRSVRHGVLSVVRITEIQHQVVGGQGVTEKVSVDGRSMNVGYDLSIVRALLDEVGVAEIQVIYDPRSAQPVAHALAYRRPEATPPR